MKKLYFIFTLLLLTRLNAEAQTKPVITGISKNQINISSGSNMIVVQGISDGDNTVDQTITINAVSSNTTLLTVDSIGYTAGNSYAVLKLTEKAKAGSVTLTVSATDADGTTNQDFTITIDQYLKHGVNWSVYDIVFWQKVNPINEKSLYDSVLTEVSMPTSDAIYDALPLTVGPIAGFPKSNFITTMFKGYLAPTVSGTYTFTLGSQDISKLFLSPDDKFENAVEVINTEGGLRTLTRTLRNDKRYAFYAVNYRVHTAYMTLEWENTTSNPAIPKTVVGGNNIFPSYDVVSPSQIKSQLIFRGIDMARLKWNKATDNEKLKGYNIYVNGLKTASTSDTSYFVKGLTSNTAYSVFVTAYDANGNESFPSNAISFTTYSGPDNGKPSPPTTVSASKISDMSADIIWSGAKDNETEVYAYNLYLDNVLYNKSGLIYEQNAVVKVLIPLTAHSITIEAIDVAGNISDKSAPFNFTTTKFNPLAHASGVKKARLNISTNGIARNEGFGINGSFLSYTFYNGNEKDLLNELKPGLLRWGALDANPLSFSTYSGQNNSITYAKFMKQCNDMGAYAEITSGIRNGTDWVSDKNTFLHFMEYLNGPASSTYGAIRASEGISEPLLKENCRGLIIEFGNEVWGESPWNSDYTVYGKWCRDVATLIKSSPYYDSTKVFFSYSGFVPGGSGTNNTVIQGDKGEVGLISISGYLDGNLAAPSSVTVGSVELDYYKNRIEAMVGNFTATQTQLKSQYKAIKRYLSSYLYESNMAPSSYNGRLGEAVIMTDYMMGMVKLGGILPTIFHLTSGQWSITSPGKKFPLFYTAKLVNHFTIGNMIKSEVQTLDSIPGEPFEAVGSYVFHEKGKYSILLLSRDFENDFQVQLNLPDNMAFSGTARKYVVTGVDFNTKDAVIDSSDVTLSDSMIVDLPKYSMVLYTFSGPALNQHDLPLGYTRYSKIDRLAISPDAGTAITTANQTLTFTPKLTPSNAIYKQVKWTVSNPDKIPVTVTLLSSGKYSVQGSGTCAGNGKITLKVMAADDTTIFDQTDVTLSGQCVNGTTNALEASISLYPNPVKNAFNIESALGNIISVRVSNLLGEQLQNIKAGRSTISLDLGNSPSGIYVIEVETEAGVIRKKILKQ